MYNRYIPQPDGSYRRNRVLEPHRPAPVPQEPIPLPPPCEEPVPPKAPQQPQSKRCPHQRPRRNPPHSGESPQSDSISSFLRKLLPKDFDTGDLLIVLLLLLMAGDCGEEQNTALLTLALYFFM